MIDSVLKGTGNSRFLKSAVPVGTSWADALAMLQAGTFPIDFNGINTEGFQQVGTPLNKANLLKDATAAQIGLPPSTTPDGMFQALGNTGELHVWRKTVKNAADVPAGYNLGTKTTKTILNTNDNSGGVSTIYYSGSVSVSDSGTVSLKNPASTGVDIYTSSLPIVGKFFYIRLSTVQTSDLIQEKIYFVPSDADISVGNSPKAFSGVVQEVTGYPLTPAGTTTTYPVSTNPNAYQEGDDAKAAGYTLGDVVSGSFVLSAKNNGSTGINWKYSDDITVSDAGMVELVNPYSATINAYGYASNAQSFRGKFVATTFEGTDFIPNTVCFIPAEANIAQSGDKLVVDRYQPVTGYPAIPAGTTIEYLGKLGDKARVQFGSYVGTGTYGYDNPNTLTFDFVPKLVIISGYTSNGYTTVTFVRGASSAGYPANGTIYFSMQLSWNDKKVSWYNNAYDADQQANKSGYRYNYVAIG